MSSVPVENARVFLLLFIALIIATWIFIDYSYETGAVYMAMGIATITGFYYAPKVVSKLWK